MLTLGAGCLACAGPAQVDKATNETRLTAEQCIDKNTTGSVEPFEKALVREGVVTADLDDIRMTKGMCEEVVERTPGGSPIARAAAVGSLIQEMEGCRSYETCCGIEGYGSNRATQAGGRSG
jgi:hypothetical protein